MNTCKIVEDLLPLYVEDLLSEESRDFVKEHVDNCKGCREELAKLEENKDKTEEDGPLESMPLASVKKKIDRDKRKYGLSLVGAVLIIISLVGFYFGSEKYIEYDGNLVEILDTERGTLLLFDEEVTQLDIQYAEDPDRGVELAYITPYRTNWDNFTRNTGNLSLLLEGDAIPYWDSLGHSEFVNMLNPTVPTHGTSLPKLVLAYYNVFTILLFIAIAAALLLIRPSLRISLSLLAIPISLLLGFLVIKGFSSVSWSIVRDLLYILIASVGIYILLFSLIKVLVKKKEDANR